jgi:hypothetical protein
LCGGFFERVGDIFAMDVGSKCPVNQSMQIGIEAAQRDAGSGASSSETSATAL